MDRSFPLTPQVLGPEQGIPAPLAEKFARLRTRFHGEGRWVVAYSGGVDSSLLALVAHREANEGMAFPALASPVEAVPDRRSLRMIAVLVDSPSLPRGELARAQTFAKDHGIPLEIVAGTEFRDPAYLRNDDQRCGHCKSALFAACRAVGERWARREPMTALADNGLNNPAAVRIAYGFHADDVADYRPGHAVAIQEGIESPLADVGLGKAEIRVLSRCLGLADADRPAAPCLASRLHYGTPVTPSALALVEAMENRLLALGFAGARARFDGQTLRIEVAPEQLPALVIDPLRSHLVEMARRHGAMFVAIDLEGFVSGKLNRALVPPLALSSPSKQ